MATSIDRRYWILAFHPRKYLGLAALENEDELDWLTGGRPLSAGDRVAFYKYRGQDSYRGIVALGEVLGPPTMAESNSDPYWLPGTEDQQGPGIRVRVRPVALPVPPLWYNPASSSVVNELSVTRAQGGTAFRIESEQWVRLMQEIGGWPEDPDAQNAAPMIRRDYFELPIIDFVLVRERGHRTQMGIYKPAGSDYVRSILTNVGEVRPNYADQLSEDLVLTYHGRGRHQDQTLESYDNRALAKNFEDGVSLRVFAGDHNRYRDWGRWLIRDMDSSQGPDGHQVLLYELVPWDHATDTSEEIQQIRNSASREARRRIREVRAQLRYAPELQQLKLAYGSVCQVDEEHDLPGRLGHKVVVHHLEPISGGGQLVTPFHSNEIVLCPNCHALFDDGSLWIDPKDGATIHHVAGDKRWDGKCLRFVEGHQLNVAVLRRVLKLHG